MYTLLIFIYVYEVKMCKLMLCCKQDEAATRGEDNTGFYGWRKEK